MLLNIDCGSEQLMSLLEKIDEDDYDTSSRVLKAVIPGYDYRKREKRARTDRRVREAIRTEIKDVEELVDDCRRRLYEDDDDVGPLSKLDRRISTFAETVEAAPSGGGFLNGDSAPDEAAMVDLVKQDAKVIDAIEDLQDKLETIYDKNDGDMIDKAREAFRTVKDTFNEREKILKRL